MSKKCVTLGMAPSFGFGDRIGLATPGHVAAMKRCGDGIAPIFPQQSIREMTRTGRSPEQVMAEAMGHVETCQWTGEVGADADHLKTPADVDATAAAGFTFFTIDPSGNVDQHADNYTETEIREKFAAQRENAPWYDKYLGSSVTLPTGTRFELNEEACMRAAVKYGRAIAAAIELANYIHKVQTSAARDYEIELSVDETEQPTTLAEHHIIASEMLAAGVKLVSLAPRFLGDF